MMKKCRNVIFIIGALMFLASCIQKPSPLLEQNIADLKNKGICERVIGGNPLYWLLVNKSFNNVLFDEAGVSLNKDEVVIAIHYQKHKNIKGFISKSDIEMYQKEFNSLDKYFSNLFNEEGKYMEDTFGETTNSLIVWEQKNYKVYLNINFSNELNGGIYLELNMFANE